MKIRSLTRCSAAALLALVTHAHGEDSSIRVNAGQVTGTTSRYMTGVTVCDVNREVYGGLYSQLIMGEHFGEPAMEPALKGFEMWGGGWLPSEGAANLQWTWSLGVGGAGDTMNASLLLSEEPLSKGEISTEVRLKGRHANRIGCFVRGSKRPDFQGGPKGLVVLLDAKNSSIELGEFDLKKVPFITPVQSASMDELPPNVWTKLSVDWNETGLNVSVNGKRVLSRSDLTPEKDATTWGLLSSPDQGFFRNLTRNGVSLAMAPESESAKADQVSRQWLPVKKGEARGGFTLVTEKTLAGKQCQRMEFAGGDGVIGIYNQGLHRFGMNLLAGKEYEGVLFARTAKPLKLTVALESADGLKTHAQQELNLAPGDWQKLEFKLTPDGSDPAGRFAVLLKAPGAVELGYAFLQPGTWGRYKGLPVRREVVEELLANGVSVIRFNSELAWMNGPQWKKDSDYYWKSAIGPRELRRPLFHCFNTHASGGWSWLEMLDLCDAADILPVLDFSMAEKPQDLLDFIEYANGPAESTWGKMRVANGHPEPFNLKFIQLGNEWLIDEAYWKLFEPLAEAIWSKYPKMIIIVGSWGINTEPQARLFENILRQAKKHDAEVWFDHHLSTRVVNPGVAPMATFQQELKKIANGAKYKIIALELNGSTHNVQRALSNAKVVGDLAKLDVPMACWANGLESDLIYPNGWSQGVVFFNAKKAWSQPSGHAIRMITASRLPLLVNSEVTGALHATAETDEARKKLTLRVVNDKEEPVSAKILLEGFGPCEPEAQVSQLSGPPLAFNSAENPEAYTARPSRWKHAEGGAQYSFPPYSFTVLQFTRK